ncbi:MAG TPA: methyltransferase domain-containing protein, partial [Candidatus Wallbacteria bacterium]|nr:methyltransferase domain-containing protein [Candidatus Wallbacteria bacterium]
LVTFEGKSVSELKNSFKEAVNDYIELCQKVNKEAAKSFKGTFMDETLKYYTENSGSYFETTKNIVISDQIDRFLSFIKDRNETIIDLGCGSGNGLKYIIEKEYSAVGADYSDQLISLAKKYTGAEIYNINIEDTAAVNEFIARRNIMHIFASASLLHLKKSVFIKFFNEIKFGGVFFFSLKEGCGESADSMGRFFAYYSRREIENIVKPRFDILDITENIDKLGRGNNWLSFIVRLKSDF